MQADHTPPVDLAGFRETMREAGVEEIVDSTLALYVQEARGLFSGLAAAIASDDAEAARANAHSLKSSSGNIWATRLAGLLGELELAASEGDLEAVSALFEQVGPEYTAVMAYLESDGES